MSTKPHLITYIDRLAGSLEGLRGVLDGELAGVFDGVHLLPFFPPIDGSDAGFDPADHTAVDARLGDWPDVAAIGCSHRLMADLIVNHISSDSPQFQDWLANGSASRYDGMFLTEACVFPGGATADDLARIYRPRPWPPFTTYEVAGEPRSVWTTFTSEQIDLNVADPGAWAYLMSVLDRFQQVGVDLVRLDAIGYAIKQPGTSSFMIPECFEFIERVAEAARARGMDVLVEIHSHHRFQMNVAEQVDRIYDFALPPLVLHALLLNDAAPLARWLAMAPRNCVTVLDTHDGIGIVDVAPEGEQAGLLTATQVDDLVASIHAASEHTSLEASGSAATNLDIYQINCTFYDALGRDDDAHLLARLIQVLAPGIPQVYYAGLLAAPNQMELLHRTGVGRDINRPYYDTPARAEAIAQPVVQATLDLLRWRAAHDDVFRGSFSCSAPRPGEFALAWTGGSDDLVASFDLSARRFTVSVAGRDISDWAGFA